MGGFAEFSVNFWCLVVCMVLKIVLSCGFLRESVGSVFGSASAEECFVLVYSALILSKPLTISRFFGKIVFVEICKKCKKRG